uniref:Uncharacterized protein n=1 Tax=Plectus sambesii TaxID=2011161 RepID=A0A914WS06_9BILA
MEARRSPQLDWIVDRTNMLEARALLADRRSVASAALRAKLATVHVDEVNDCGEPLIVAVVRHVVDESDRVKFLKLLLREGADVNAQDRRDQRTALMYICIDDLLSAGRVLLEAENLNLQIQDRNGNTAIMHAAMRGRDELMNLMIAKLSRTWSSVLQLKNCMGNTAEDLAIRNHHHRCARMVQGQRLHMVACLNRQLDMLGRIGCRQWRAFTTVYKCAEKWKPRSRRKSADYEEKGGRSSGSKRKQSF